MPIGVRRMKVESQVGLEVRKLLSSEQLSKQHPILQDDYDRIGRIVTASVYQEYYVDDGSLLTSLHSEPTVLTGILVAQQPLDFASFRSTYPSFTEQMLALHLGPQLTTQFTGHLASTVEGTSNECVRIVLEPRSR